MVILTAKVSKGKLAAALLLLLAAVVLVVVLLHHTGSAEAIAGSAQSSQAQTAPAKVKTNDDRVAFLESFGWKLEPQPLQEQDVRIPTDPRRSSSATTSCRSRRATTSANSRARPSGATSTRSRTTRTRRAITARRCSC
jgi:hypothetical protein